jgi:signal transduction histidine kinase
MTDKLFRAARSRRLAILLLAVTVPPAVALVWLGWQLLLQDRSLLAQRDFERRQAATDAVVHSLQLSVTDAERHLLDGPLPAGMVRLLIGPAGMEAQPPDRVAWLPRETNTGDPFLANSFADAERLEFQGHLDRAAAAYQEGAQASTRTALQSGALMRLARVRRQQRRWDDALRAYRDLARVDDVLIGGAPASLQARRAICAVLFDAERPTDLAREAKELERDVLAGRWALDRPAWELTIADLEHWTGRAVTVGEERPAFSAAADAIWNDGVQDRRAVLDLKQVVTVLHGARQDGTRVALAISSDVVRAWAERAMASNGAGTTTQVSIITASGAPLIGGLTAGASTTKIAESDSALPWAVLVHTGAATSAETELANRRRLLSGALVAMLLLLGGGSYFLWRVVRRELAVARLQADFVSAVSHEFRTPLTALRYATELLQESDDVTPDRRAAFYDTLGRNTERLHRLVESLLDFGRMESGRKPYDLRAMAVGPVVTTVVEDFQREVAARGVAVGLDIRTPSGLQVRGDASALANAIWNLLDNAVKYSPERPGVSVSIDARGACVGISVRDEGLGIPLGEQRDIFRRFVRGQRAMRMGIKGTGLGLAMVSHIIQAHKGSIELASEENVGSTFTIVLPVVS